jgi:hypothetical protein
MRPIKKSKGKMKKEQCEMILKDLLLLSTGASVVVSEALHKIDESGPICGLEPTLTRVSAFSASGHHDETSMRDPSPLAGPLYSFSGSVPPNAAAFTITGQWR